MDRWSNEDSFERGPRGPAGNVARLGIGGFVASTSSAAKPEPGAEPAPKIEVVASRREQRRELAQASAPAPRPSIPAAPAPASYARPVPAAVPQIPTAQTPAHPPPPWSAEPPEGWALRVCKEGDVLHTIPLSTSSCLFGRDASADVVVDHASCSRKHAQLGYRKASRSWGAVDLGSTHGTFVDGVRLKPGAAKEMKPESQLRLGASTRFYTMQAPARAGSKRPPAADQGSDVGRKSVRFGESGGLEQIIGYSDGRQDPDKSFAVNVGPVANDGTLEGQFSHAVEAPDLDARVKGKTGAQLDGIARVPTVTKATMPRPEPRTPRRPQPLVKAKAPGLYGDLPDAERS